MSNEQSKEERAEALKQEIRKLIIDGPYFPDEVFDALDDVTEEMIKEYLGSNDA